MNIYAKKGDKVKLKTLNAGYDSEKEIVLHYLVLNEVYTVSCTEVGDFHTDVYLEEFPGVCFNSVFFEDYKELKDAKYWWKEIKENFDWKKVRKAMKQIGGEYIEEDGVDVPSVKRLKETAKRLVKTAFENKTLVSSEWFEAEFVDNRVAFRFVIQCYYDVFE